MAEVTGYTVTAGTKYDNLHTIECPGWSGPESVLWQLAAVLQADLESRNESEVYTARITRHEKDDVILDAAQPPAPDPVPDAETPAT
ncbi:hypothetical protein OHB41_25770 [Streptomyces sp. NBC_01571]|uniref:hypothetical protein n=1 Tax=Streptomyces sp. NBC_01571 TaxID=2975883 RepID=UPI00225AA3C0|nr:hypothetical protein [Streptomyces sp. NBC_01571]MCX4576519.1 hypothetical protein [Streptomyces sp. NBC_01571]